VTKYILTVFTVAYMKDSRQIQESSTITQYSCLEEYFLSTSVSSGINQNILFSK